MEQWQTFELEPILCRDYLDDRLGLYAPEWPSKTITCINFNEYKTKNYNYFTGVYNFHG